MTVLPDIPKRLAARIRKIQGNILSKRESIFSAEVKLRQASERVSEFEANPGAFANRYYPRQGADSYPVQTNISRNREVIEYYTMRHPQRYEELAVLEEELQQVEAEILQEVSRMRPTAGRVPWPPALQPFDDHHQQYKKEWAEFEEEVRIENIIRMNEIDMDFEEDMRLIQEESDRYDEEWKREFLAMSPEKQAAWRAVANAITKEVMEKRVRASDIVALAEKRGNLHDFLQKYLAPDADGEAGKK